MKNASKSNVFRAGVAAVALLAAVSISTQAYAWGEGRFSGGAHAAATSSGEGWKSKFHRNGNASAQGAQGLKHWGSRATHANAAAAQGQATAAAGGWRSRLQAKNAATPASQSGTRTGTYTTDHHGDGTFTQDYTRGDGTSTRQNTVTNQNGQTASWTTQQSLTHSNGTINGSTTVTGENGKSVEQMTSLNTKTDTLTRTDTGPNGQTHSITLQGDGTPGDGDRTGTYTTSGGKTGTYDQKVSYNDGTITRDNTVTNSSGQSASWQAQVSGSSANGVTSVDKTITGQNGKTESWDTSYNKTTDTLTHTYTAPNGQTYGGSATFNQ